MKNLRVMWAAFVLAFLALASCTNDEDANGEGKVSLNVTDAPIDEADVTGVFVTFTSVEYQMDGGSWEVFEEFDGPQTINLLELQNGETAFLGEFNGSAGNYTGLRFHLDAVAKNGSQSSNPGCYITFEDGSEEPLYVPSGEQTGYKAIGDFTVPVNGVVEVTADFDLRKSVTKAGATEMYILKPTIRVIVNDQAGEISGQVENSVEGSTYVVYAYEEGTYSEAEMDEPEGEGNRFPTAVTSTTVDAEGNYKLAFLAPGDYEVIVVEMDEEGNPVVKDQESGITLSSSQSVELDFSLEAIIQ
ncbi:DUF4382 domain-containing protein [Echinicola jeungdonensis]|uniref:DUF4382 domain-containing protein n=1 Tax=Echinicola jeungdonensis TaxID=709343 RepID=A0ABV5J5Z5_9BACT|nr:DUF4382 domain-containing protein [Echinicola jeungdonensis]MDN3668081.1 DUF4382 domain-containing protein [Echinicola jeungdonensis]